MDLGMERELLELAAPDLEMFLRTAGGYSAARAAPRSMGAQVSARTSCQASSGPCSLMSVRSKEPDPKGREP